MGRPDEESLIATLDTGTSSIRCMIFNSQRQVLAKHQLEIRRIYPQPSWVEQDPEEIIEKSVACMNKAADDLIFAGYDVKNIKGLGITNQRETTVVWDKHTGKPLYNAILWLDNRTADLAASFINGKGKGSQDHIRSLCGLPIHPYFSALKLRWIIDNVAVVREAVNKDRCLFGTVDTWVLWNLTGGIEGGVHKTDVTNASRTMLMNLNTMNWDPKLINFFDVPSKVLPKICSSSEVFGEIKITYLAGRSVCGAISRLPWWDMDVSRAAPLKTRRFRSSIEEPKLCQKEDAYFQIWHRMFSAGKYRPGGPDARPVYALEGSVAMGGALVDWLKKNLGLIDKVEDIDKIAGSVADSGGVYFVPAFSGLLAPYWDTQARGIICGLTEYVEQAHFARAALEAVAFQTCEIIDAIKQDSGIGLTGLQVDGGMSSSNLLMQMQSDFSGIPVSTPDMKEVTSIGAAVAVAHATGVTSFVEAGKVTTTSTSSQQKSSRKQFIPRMEKDERMKKYSYWKEAVRRSMHWSGEHPMDRANLDTKPCGTTAANYAAVAVGSVASTLAITGLAAWLIKKYWR